MRDSGRVFPQRTPGWQRVLNLLDDRGWHSSYELATTCSVLTHSRIAECRSKGYDIESRRVAGEEGLRAFQYRLVGTPDEAAQGGEPLTSLPAVSSGAPAQETSPGSWLTGGTADGTGAPELHPGQLVLEGAA